jgi:hypothetical protein
MQVFRNWSDSGVINGRGPLPEHLGSFERFVAPGRGFAPSLPYDKSAPTCLRDFCKSGPVAAPERAVSALNQDHDFLGLIKVPFARSQ